MSYTYLLERGEASSAECFSDIPAYALMGWPVMWTELMPLGMVKFQQWLRSHGELFQEKSISIK